MHIRREYIHGPGIDNSIAMITFYDDELVGLYFYHTDALGNVIALTSGNGVVEEKPGIRLSAGRPSTIAAAAR